MQHFDRQAGERLLMFVLSMVASLCAGFFGGIVTQFFEPVSQEASTNMVFSKQQQTAFRTAGDRSSAFLEDGPFAVFTLYVQPPDFERRAWHEQFFNQNDRSGYALGITSDGWLVIPSSALTRSIASVRVVDSEKRVFRVREKREDPVLGVAYLKIDTRSVRTLPFAQREELTDGTHGILVTPFESKALLLTQPRYRAMRLARDAIQNSDELAKRLNPDNAFETLGALVATERGAIAGITDSYGIIPAPTLKESFSKTLRSLPRRRVQLRLSYIDNAWMPVIPHAPGRDVLRLGATLVSDLRTIRLRTADGTVFLENGDTIISVDGENIDANRSFSEIIQQYASGDTSTIAVQTKAGVQLLKLRL